MDGRCEGSTGGVIGACSRQRYGLQPERENDDEDKWLHGSISPSQPAEKGAGSS